LESLGCLDCGPARFVQFWALFWCRMVRRASNVLFDFGICFAVWVFKLFLCILVSDFILSRPKFILLYFYSNIFILLSVSSHLLADLRCGWTQSLPVTPHPLSY
jgi:hypothetical protein